MLFNSLAFALFLPVVFVLYWFVMARSLRAQNLLIIAASFVFYGWWDWRFLFLLVGTSLVDYFAALTIDRTGDKRRRKILLGLSLTANLGVLGTFKYFDFFAHSFHDAFASVGIQLDIATLGFILPVGISFYTFQALSYTIDVYRSQLKATRDPFAFMAFISFFPQLVAGPIERATNMLPQMLRPRVFSSADAADGMRQMLWGFFKKVVIADNCAPVVNDIFAHHHQYGASTLLLGAFLFAFQIYGDFSGYSDIAIGCGRLFGIKLMRNFAFPYFSRDIAEFWRRWHISLNTWFRDYLYFPLGGSRGGAAQRVRNIMVIFLVSGLWHGANWTFVAWGAFNALLFIPLMLSGRNRKYLDHAGDGRLVPSLRELAGILVTFGFTLVAWVLFRADTITQAFDYLRRMAARSLFSASHVWDPWLMSLIGLLVVSEWINRTRQHALEVDHLPAWGRRLIYTAVFGLIFVFGRFASTDFIYFQF